MTDEDIKVLSAYIESRKSGQESHKEKHKSRFDEVKEQRKDSEFSAAKERQITELAILNDSLALIYDYISEKK
jgi:hypothetical protein